MNTPVRIGVVGVGWWANMSHLPGLVSYERADVVAIADPDGEKRSRVGDHFGIERRYATVEDLLAAGGVDGLVIAVPHAAHHEVAVAALDAGCHVLVEKPMALRAVDAWDLVDRARSRGLHLVVGYTHQFNANARRVREIVRSGRLGEIRLVSGLFASVAESFFAGRPEDYVEAFGLPLAPEPETYADPVVAGGGQGQTQVTHTMGMALWVTGLRPVEVFARMADHGLSVDLVDAITYRCQSGALGTMASTGSLRPGQPPQQELRYFGSEGSLVQDVVSGELDVRLNDGTVETLPGLSGEEAYPGAAPSRCLVDLIVGDGENLAPGEPAAVAVEFLEAAYRSAATDAPVSLNAAIPTQGSGHAIRSGRPS